MHTKQASTALKLGRFRTASRRDVKRNLREGASCLQIIFPMFPWGLSVKDPAAVRWTPGLQSSAHPSTSFKKRRGAKSQRRRFLFTDYLSDASVGTECHRSGTSYSSDTVGEELDECESAVRWTPGPQSSVHVDQIKLKQEGCSSNLKIVKRLAPRNSPRPAAVRWTPGPQSSVHVDQIKLKQEGCSLNLKNFKRLAPRDSRRLASRRDVERNIREGASCLQIIFLMFPWGPSVIDPAEELDESEAAASALPALNDNTSEALVVKPVYAYNVNSAELLRPQESGFHSKFLARIPALHKVSILLLKYLRDGPAGDLKGF
ncbi:hypothetical protein R1flu_002550 [Riccia fluitans]|uniref:Uncharacterized protein n=1 Tax=Riccia fluitans TaxID=41844 RepID=A0ABD1Y6L7_9MARC